MCVRTRNTGRPGPEIEAILARLPAKDLLGVWGLSNSNTDVAVGIKQRADSPWQRLLWSKRRYKPCCSSRPLAPLQLSSHVSNALFKNVFLKNEILTTRTTSERPHPRVRRDTAADVVVIREVVRWSLNLRNIVEIAGGDQ